MADAASSPSASDRSINVNGVTLYYEEQGEGDPVILLHGGLVSSAMWQAVLPHLVDGFSSGAGASAPRLLDGLEEPKRGHLPPY